MDRVLGPTANYYDTPGCEQTSRQTRTRSRSPTWLLVLTVLLSQPGVLCYHQQTDRQTDTQTDRQTRGSRSHTWLAGMRSRRLWLLVLALVTFSLPQIMCARHRCSHKSLSHTWLLVLARVNFPLPQIKCARLASHPLSPTESKAGHGQVCSHQSSVFKPTEKNCNAVGGCCCRTQRKKAPLSALPSSPGAKRLE